MGKDKKRKKKNKYAPLMFKSVRSNPPPTTDLNEDQIRALFNVMHHPDASTRKLVETYRNNG